MKPTKRKPSKVKIVNDDDLLTYFDNLSELSGEDVSDSDDDYVQYGSHSDGK